MGRLVVVGAGMAAARLVARLLELDAPWRITLVGEEPALCYNRVLLSSLLAGQCQRSDLALLTPRQLDRVECLAGARAVALDLARRTLSLADGRRLSWDRLVLATGARTRRPEIPGAAAAGVLAFRTLEDLDALRAGVAGGAPAVVVGGGLLGLEAAAGLAALGAAVTVVHRRPHPMNRQLDAPAGELLRSRLAERGIAFRTGTPLRIAGRGGRAAAVELADGARLPARWVVWATGIEPAAELARSAGLPCGRGVRVDGFLATAASGVYALGECCELDGQTFGLVAPVYRQAEVLAARLAGRAVAPFRPRAEATRLKIAGIDLFSVGTPPGAGEAVSDLCVCDPARGVYRRLAFQGGRLAAAIFLGDLSGAARCEALLASGEPAGAAGEALLFGIAA
ncbi:MAG: pyridine nucleotide-disulfide oxidoreductase [Porticoccaceae bacterium]|nr:MAG: pyridine nucleotide-disulfide oxidoreductase [Porticoccaceae bacterium]